LDRVASAFPSGERLVEQILQVSREGLSESIHDGFVFTLAAVAFAIIAAILMKNKRLGEQGAAPVADPGSRQERLVTGITLEYLARRIEGANGDAPDLISAVSNLVPDADGSERERALLAVDRVLRPLALEALRASLERNGARQEDLDDVRQTR